MPALLHRFEPWGSDEPACTRPAGWGARFHRVLLVGSLLGWAGCTPAVAEQPRVLPALAATRAGPPSDRDGDRFLDDRDACPDVRGIAPDGCPERDSDGDGFLDSIDRCPSDPGVEPHGCPIPDTDGDGILDPDDTCVDKLETMNGYEDEDGCPDEIPADLAKMTGPIRGIHFDLDKDTIRPTSRPVLEKAIRVLQKYPKIRIEISGHMDSTGTVQYCRDISARRASAIKRYLVEHGVEDARLERRGAGPDEPLDTNKTARGRAHNRRIEFTILVQ